MVGLRYVTKLVLGGLGIKDLDCFNQALLAKIRWRILDHPQSLSAQILKAKYFPNEQFCVARSGPKPSPLWPSILWEGLLLQGLGWRIGSGSHIQIWNDN